MTESYLLIIVWGVCGIAGGLIWQSKGGPLGYGFLMGVLLGPIGVVAALVMTPKEARARTVERCATLDSFGQQCSLQSGHQEPHRA